MFICVCVCFSVLILFVFRSCVYAHSCFCCFFLARSCVWQSLPAALTAARRRLRACAAFRCFCILLLRRYQHVIAVFQCCCIRHLRLHGIFTSATGLCRLLRLCKINGVFVWVACLSNTNDVLHLQNKSNTEMLMLFVLLPIKSKQNSFWHFRVTIWMF